MVGQGHEQCEGGPPPFPYIESYNHLDIFHTRLGTSIMVRD
jgi:hypothetical protein